MSATCISAQISASSHLTLDSSYLSFPLLQLHPGVYDATERNLTSARRNNNSTTIMATISQPVPLAGASLLEKLPPELVEKILLEVVSDVTPPSERTGDRRCHPLRRNLRIASGISIASGLLRHRLVSRTIWVSSWRSLAKVLGETIFDMCSKESMANLVELTSCASLAPWMNKITVSCFKVNETYPLSYEFIEEFGNDDVAFANLNDVCRNELLRLRDLDKIWYRNDWAFPSTRGGVSTDDLYRGINVEFQRGLKKMVSACLACLVNLDNVCYFYDEDHVPARFREFAHQYESDHIPARFRELAYRYESGDLMFGVATGDENQAGADLGVWLLLDILAFAQLQPKRLSLAVNLESPHYFLTSSWTTTSCLRRVEELTLTDPGDAPRAWQMSSSFISAIQISKTIFPNLRSLSVEIGCFPDSWSKNGLSLPQALDLPELRHVSITGGIQSCPRILNFLKLLKGTVQSVSLRKMKAISYEDIINVLRSFELDVLVIHDGGREWWKGDTYDMEGFRGVPKGLLESIAKTVILGPEGPGE